MTDDMTIVMRGDPPLQSWESQKQKRQEDPLVVAQSGQKLASCGSSVAFSSNRALRVSVHVVCRSVPSELRAMGGHNSLAANQGPHADARLGKSALPFSGASA